MEQCEDGGKLRPNLRHGSPIVKCLVALIGVLGQISLLTFGIVERPLLRLLNNTTLRNHYSGQRRCLHALTIIGVTTFNLAAELHLIFQHHRDHDKISKYHCAPWRKSATSSFQSSGRMTASVQVLDVQWEIASYTMAVHYLRILVLLSDVCILLAVQKLSPRRYDGNLLTGNQPMCKYLCLVVSTNCEHHNDDVDTVSMIRG